MPTPPTVEPTMPCLPLRTVPLDEHDTSYFADSARMRSFSIVFSVSIYGCKITNKRGNKRIMPGKMWQTLLDKQEKASEVFPLLRLPYRNICRADSDQGLALQAIDLHLRFHDIVDLRRLSLHCCWHRHLNILRRSSDEELILTLGNNPGRSSLIE